MEESVVYLDSSVALAHVLSQGRQPPLAFWHKRITSSRLLQHEVWNRVHAYSVNAYRHEKARTILRRVNYVEMTAETLARSLRPFPVLVRTLDGLHLATMDHLRTRGVPAILASYDTRLAAAAQAMGFGTVEP